MCTPRLAIVCALVAMSSGLSSLAPVVSEAKGWIDTVSGLLHSLSTILYINDTVRSRPTTCDNFAYAQLIESSVIERKVETPRETPCVISKGSSGLPGLGKVHGKVPSIRSSGRIPACRAAARMNIFTLDPVCRRRRATFTSLVPGTNPSPPTIARTPPV